MKKIIGILTIFIFLISFTSALTYYINDGHSSCSDSQEKATATTSNPYCSINAGINNATAGDIIEVWGGPYAEGIYLSTNINSGTVGSPIIIRGPSSDNKTTLDGSTASELQGVDIDGVDNWKVQNFRIYNFSADGFNAHSVGSDQAENVWLEYSDVIYGGFGGGGGDGDGVSFHENTTGGANYVNIINVSSEGIIDIEGAMTNYSHIYINLNNVAREGIYFQHIDYGDLGRTHYLNNITVKNARVCLRTNLHNVVAENMNCINNTGLDQFYIQGNFIGTNIKTTGTNTGSYESFRITTDGSGWVYDSIFDEDIEVSTNQLNITNTTYDSLQLGGSASIIKSWYLTFTSNADNPLIQLWDINGNEYYNGGVGTIIAEEEYYTSSGASPRNYSINATYDGQLINYTQYSLSTNDELAFTFSNVGNQAIATICEESDNSFLEASGIAGIILTIILVGVVISVLILSYNGMIDMGRVKKMDIQLMDVVVSIVVIGLTFLIIATMAYLLGGSYCPAIQG